MHLSIQGTCVATPGFVSCGGRHDITPLVLSRRHSGVEVTVTSVGTSRELRSSWDPPCPISCIIREWVKGGMFLLDQVP